jgi:primosomal protein N' (replication factor Y) (superfamily II helicase)
LTLAAPPHVADVVFDVPLDRPFSYLVPDGLSVAVGQRVSAPLGERSRVGVVVALRPEGGGTLKPLQSLVEPAPILSGAALELGRWIADESLSSWGSTLLAMLPPPPRSRHAEIVAPAPEPARSVPPSPIEVWTDAAREERLVAELGQAPGGALVIAPDTESAGRWAERLDAARLDSGAPTAERRAAWFASARGRSRVVVGTRGALLVPVASPGTLVLLDEQDAAHKPPGPPRLHSRDILRRRAGLEGSRLLMLAGAPSVESWQNTLVGAARRVDDATAAAWPEVIAADTRGILRNHPLTLPLTRAVETMSREGRSVLLVVSRSTGALGCNDCGAVLRCPECGVALSVRRDRRSLACRLCARAEPLPERCPECGGHKLAPFGWDPERVEASVRRRFPRLRVSRTDREAQVVIGTPALLRAPRSHPWGAVGFIWLDGLLRTPDFRAGERVFQLLWAAAERTGADGRVVVQTLHPEHYALGAVRDRDRAAFYELELQFRSELGYPPFRRLCQISARGKTATGARALVDEVAATLGGLPGLTIYPAMALGAATASTATRMRFVIKGPEDLPRRIGPPLRPFLERGRRAHGMLEIEMDPVQI